MSKSFKVISPVDGSIYCERDYAQAREIEEVLNKAKRIKRDWKKTPIEKRAEICQEVVAYFEEHAEKIAEEITWQMGRPIAYSPYEIQKGFLERAKYMISAAARALQDVQVHSDSGFSKFIRKEPIGPTLVLSPWNYPYLTAVNAVIPAIMAGNPVILKAAEQTPLTAEHFQKAFDEAGCPEGVFQYLHLSHSQIPDLIQSETIKAVFFTGSVAGGKAVQAASNGKFLAMGFELGGKDPAYVAADADITNAVENLVDGAFFNSGQSCCAIERIYAHQDIYDEFLDKFRIITENYKVGNPLDPETTLGPMVRKSAANKALSQISEATRMGAQSLVAADHFDPQSSPYFNPQAFFNVNHEMGLMTEESFAPIVGIMSVSSDEEAIQLMNDSQYGLTASIWTSDQDRALAVGNDVETGTLFMNRCDYLDPSLAWTGAKNSGHGCTLSTMGYNYVTRPKSFHLKFHD